MKPEAIRLRLTETKRLIMHNGPLADPLNPITKELGRLTSKSAEDGSRSLADQPRRMVRRLVAGRRQALHPGEALMATFVQAAKTRKKGAEAKVGLIVDSHAALEYVGPADLDELWEDKRFRLRVGVKVQKRANDAHAAALRRLECGVHGPLLSEPVRPSDGRRPLQGRGLHEGLGRLATPARQFLGGSHRVASSTGGAWPGEAGHGPAWRGGERKPFSRQVESSGRALHHHQERKQPAPRAPLARTVEL